MNAEVLERSLSRPVALAPERAADAADGPPPAVRGASPSVAVYGAKGGRVLIGRRAGKMGIRLEVVPVAENTVVFDEAKAPSPGSASPRRPLFQGEVCPDLSSGDATVRRPKHRKPLYPKTAMSPSKASTEVRFVLRRDRCCRVPGCGRVGDPHVHHVVFKSLGGSDDRTNLVRVCNRHHNQIHDHLPGPTVLRVTGTAPDGLTWERLDAATGAWIPFEEEG